MSSPLREVSERARATLRAVAMLVLLLLAACGTPPRAEPVVSPVPPSSHERVVLYFPHRSRPVLLREVRQAERRGEQPEWFALQQLLLGPALPEGRPVLPGLSLPGTQAGASQLAIAAKVFEGDVNLLLTRSAADALVQGKDLLPVYALVNTLCSFPRVTAVHFSVEGQREPLKVAGVDLSQPLQPRWDLVAA